jgi:hypothetical protein
MAFELVRSAFVCYEVLALRSGDPKSATHKAPIAARSQKDEYRYFTGTTGAVLPVR